jgi:AcrR family transcriptional regulator
MKARPTKHRRSGRPSHPVARAKLIELAQQAFAEFGYPGASMEEIARRAGFRKASLFHHFQSKSRLYTEAIGAATADLGGLVADAARRGGTFLERLDGLGDTVVAYLGNNPPVARLLVREIVDGGRYLKGPGADLVRIVLTAIGAFLETGMDEGVIARQDTAQLAASIIGLHLFYFAASEFTAEITGEHVFETHMIEARKANVRDHVRRLCGAPLD